MTITSILRSGTAGLVLTLAAGCATVHDAPAPVPGSTPAATTTTAGARPAPDNAGWRRIHAGAGRT